MIPTIRIFTQALLTPDLSFETLGDARAVLGADGLPVLRRTTRFVEAEIEWRGTRHLLSLPLNPSAMFRIERTATALRKINCPALTEYRILPHELHWQDAYSNLQISDLVLQPIPSGGGFSDILHTEYGATLLVALDALEAELKRAGFVHRNLKPNNLIWSDGRLYPLRYHDAVIGPTEASDAADFESLRHLDNRPVIAPQFLWAGDFHEGRAEVQTAEGMGLIDREGKFVLPAIYEIVEYDPATSDIRARRHGLWARFDYTGRQLTEFAPLEKEEVEA